ncbi:MAG: Holliday junction branch migration protein RuvA [Actinobacteria bacterium HGW-Actinobacteria-9]|nr:MAG: Holliday junction branch migration protein RuvA [Actinobacteria bacterium HGW-Actinobacteria-9]
MIAFLTGRVAERTGTHVLLDVNGVGYRLAMSTTSLCALPALGDTVTIHTHLHVREDELSLYGFQSQAEMSLFEMLITVSGVGPKVALAALSSFTPDDLASAICAEDVILIGTIPGVGKKTAQRIVLDLKDRLQAAGMSVGPGGSGTSAARSTEAREALQSMGFSSAEIAAAMKGFDGDPGDSKGQLKHALKRLGGGA